MHLDNVTGFPGGSLVKNPPTKQECWFNPWFGKIPWRRKWQPIPVFLPGKSHGQQGLAGYDPWGHKKSDRNWQLSTHTNNGILFTLERNKLQAMKRHEGSLNAYY